LCTVGQFAIGYSLFCVCVFILPQLNEDKTKVRRIKPLEEPTDVDERTVYVVRDVHKWMSYNFKVNFLFAYSLVAFLRQN